MKTEQTEKTAMETLIKYCIKNAESVESPGGNKIIVVDYELMHDEFDLLLELEKQQIIEAWQHGSIRVPKEMQHINNAEQYYLTKYKR